VLCCAVPSLCRCTRQDEAASINCFSGVGPGMAILLRVCCAVSIEPLRSSVGQVGAAADRVSWEPRFRRVSGGVWLAPDQINWRNRCTSYAPLILLHIPPKIPPYRARDVSAQPAAFRPNSFARTSDKGKFHLRALASPDPSPRATRHRIVAACRSRSLKLKGLKGQLHMYHQFPP
jgi:hypothetical protein